MFNDLAQMNAGIYSLAETDKLEETYLDIIKESA